MENKKEFWRSRIEIISEIGHDDLQKAINKFCEDKFVVGIQYPDSLQNRGFMSAVISYKVQENSE